MSNIYSIVLLALLSLVNSGQLRSQPPSIEWTHFYDDSLMYAVNGDAVQTPDGSFFAVGGVVLRDSSNSRAYILKTDSTGSVDWFRIYRAGVPGGFSCALHNPDGNIVVGGWTLDSNLTNVGLLAVITPTGDTLWTRTVNPDSNQFAEFNGLIRASNGDCIATGQTVNEFTHRGNGFAVRFSTNSGQISWQRTYTDEQGRDLALWSACNATENGFLMSGRSGNFPEPNRFAYLLRVDSLGNRLWTHEYTFGTSRNSAFQGSCPTADNGFLIPAWGQNPGRLTCHVIRIDATGDTLWTRAYPSFAGLSNIQPSPTEGFVCLADTIVNSHYAAALIKLDTMGQISWAIPIARPDANVYSSSLVITPDSGYAMWMDVETGFPPNNSSWNMCTRFSPERLDATMEFASMSTTLHLEQNFPNPFNATTTITFSLPRKMHVTLRVFDLIGREVVTLSNAVMSSGLQRFVLDGRHLPSGTYLCQLRSADYSITQKLLLVR
jgi:hypothetical protein